MPTYTLQGPNGQTVEVVANSEAEAIAKASGQSGPSGTAAPSTGRYNAGGLEDLGDGYYRNQQGVTYREGPRGGLSQVGGPTAGMIKDSTEAASGLSRALAGIDRVDAQLAEIDTTGPAAWLSNPTNMAVLKQSILDLQLRMKEDPYNLGVLNGPDLMLLNQIVESPDSLKSAIMGGSLRPRLRNLANIIGQNYRQQESQFAGQGGRTNAMAALYQSPRSQYTAQEWGRDAAVPQNAFARVAGGTQPSRPAAPRGQSMPNFDPALAESFVSGVGAAPNIPSPDPRAVAYLRQNPNLAAAFDQKYGRGAAARALGGRRGR